MYLWAWAIFTAYMTVAALRVNVAVLLVFVLLTITFILLAIGAVGPHATVTHWGGYLGLATAAAAWYASFAAVTNSTFGRTVLPVVPLGARRPDGEGRRARPLARPGGCMVPANATETERVEMATEPTSVSGEALDRELAELLEVETLRALRRSSASRRC